jgi:hypothetical protein
MQRVKLLGLILMAMFALGAITSTTASAEELPNILPAGTTNFKDKSGKGKFQTSESKKIVECAKDTSSGRPGSVRLGTFDVLFEECKDPSTGAECWGLDDELSQKSVLVLGTYHVRYQVPASGKKVAVIFLIKHVHFLCEFLGIKVLILVLGCAVGEVPTEFNNKLTKTYKVVLTQKEGKNTITEVENEKNTGKENCSLTSQEGEKGKVEQAGEETTEEVEGFKEGSKEVEALIMA